MSPIRKEESSPVVAVRGRGLAAHWKREQAQRSVAQRRADRKRAALEAKVEANISRKRELSGDDGYRSSDYDVSDPDSDFGIGSETEDEKEDGFYVVVANTANTAKVEIIDLTGDDDE